MTLHRTAGGLFALGVVAAAGVVAGCRPNPSANQPAAPAGPGVPVPVSKPVQRQVTEFVEYTGRADAVDTIGVKARATGYLKRAPFTEGGEVKGPEVVDGRMTEGDLLFEVDPQPYQAQLDQAEAQAKQAAAQVEVAKAQVVYADEYLKRLQNAGDAASKIELAQARASQAVARAQVKAAEASEAAAEPTARVYRLNLGYTKVYSPISGQVSRAYYTVGNLVTQDQTLLTTVVSTDPVYGYFDMDERTLLRVRAAINAGRIQARNGPGEGDPAVTAAVGAASGAGSFPVYMGLEGEDGFPHAGTINFINNVVNPSTGTIAIRGRFPNPRPENGRRLVSPGMFLCIRLPIGQSHPALLVVDRAIGSDQGLKYVYVVKDG